MGTSPYNKGHRQRLRNRLTKDPLQLADYEILELLLGYVLARKDTKPLAKELLLRFETLYGVFGAKNEELRQVPGFGPQLAVFWTLWREMWARLAESPLRTKAAANEPKLIARMAVARLGTAETEEFWVAFVDSMLNIISWECLSKGTVDRAAVYPREIMKRALALGATALFLVHNHPAGQRRPSLQDQELTDQVISSARELEIHILDHIIVANNEYFSFNLSGYL